ncbi:MAG TPA: phosphate ABC transporter ATP-binding protein [Candidatus Cybelea sp.]|jgi:phosphate transport system ATP-binding protein|nr:phosphate ABC transporter ATP-binding protein [Candidatus Cybelea sp.]
MSAVATEVDVVLATDGLSAYYGTRKAIGDVSIGFRRKAITALIGPSGCGKTTLLRCLNRIHEVSFDARVEGDVLLDGRDIYSNGVDPMAIRRRIGMVFQRPNPFPTLSILDNTVAFAGAGMGRQQRLECAQRALQSAALWNEVKDKLRSSPLRLSGGQQQRLCIARAIAAQPEVLLMDEPTASLDPIATAVIEELMSSLSSEFTIVAVTHNMQQAARVSDVTAFMLADESGIGRLIEIDETGKLFTKPADRRTEDYITGRFG